MVPVLARNTSESYPFWVALIKALEAKKDGALKDKIVIEGLEQLSTACFNAVIPLWDSADAYSYYGYAQTTKVPRVIELLDLCITTKHMPYCKILLASVLKSTGTTTAKFPALYTPLISRLPEALRKRNIDILTAPFSEAIKALVGQYLHEVVGDKPKGSKVTMRKAGCGCVNCNALDSFLVGPNASSLFRLPVARKSHVEKRVQKIADLVSYTIVTTGRPHIQISKSPEIVAVGKWGTKITEARTFLKQVGDEILLAKLMGTSILISRRRFRERSSSCFRSILSLMLEYWPRPIRRL